MPFENFRGNLIKECFSLKRYSKSKMSGYGSGGVQGGRAEENPKYETYVRTTPITVANGQLAILNSGVGVEFDRLTGHQKIVLKFGDTDISPVCSFSITGGANNACSEGRPIFPNVNQTYNKTINYVTIEGQNGCILQALPELPKTSKSARINRFVLQELVTGNNFYFRLEMSPFSNIPSLITFPLSGTFRGYISDVTGSYGLPGTTLTVLEVPPSTILSPGSTISAVDVTVGTQINAQITGTLGGIGVYTVSIAQVAGGSINGEVITVAQNGPILDNVFLRNTVYRGVPYMREAGTPVSFAAPQYYERNLLATFLSSGGVNPLDLNLPLPFRRFSGQQDIVVTLSTGFYFQFSIDYGILGQAGGYLGLAAPNANVQLVKPDPENCVVEFIPSATPQVGTQQALSYLVTTPNDPGGARVYVFTFDPAPYTQTPPTIQLLNAIPFGAVNVETKVVTRVFQTI